MSAKPGQPITVTFRVPSAIESAIAARQHDRGKAQVVQTIIRRYLHLIEQETATLGLTPAEVRVCYEALHTLTMNDEMIDHLAGIVTGNMMVNSQHSGARIQQLAAKLTALTPGQRLALIDGIERARSLTYPEPDDDLHTRLRKVGFHV